METTLAGQEGVLCHMDDVLIFGQTQHEHDARLHAALQKIQAAGTTLNLEKCEFYRDCLTFVGHVIDEQGVSPDPHKTSAIVAMERPQTPTDFLGMVNQLGKFTPNIAEMSQPLCELLSSKKSWVWGPPQESAIEKIKKELTQPTVLALYNPDGNLKISTDVGWERCSSSSTQPHSGGQWHMLLGS